VTLRVLADENVPFALVGALRRRGHDVSWAVTLMPGAGDAEVLRRAALEGRTCVTLDKDFGELAARMPEAAAHGIILLRLPVHRAEVADQAAALIHSRDDWPGHLAVIEPGRLRMRRLGDPAAG
jgi:predicted nuclease of predicted toxin-antitoxin system